MSTNPAKKKKSPNFIWQSMERKAWPMMKVKNMLTETLIDCPADRISNGKISLGTNQPNGPQDHAKAATYKQINVNAMSPMPLEKVPSPFTPNTDPTMHPTAIYIVKFH